MENKINLYELISSTNLETPEQGDIIHEKIFPLVKNYLDKNESFYITFTNIDNVTTAFLNNCIGKLFFELDRDKVAMLMSFSDFTNKAQIKTLSHSISNAMSLSKIK